MGNTDHMDEIGPGRAGVQEVEAAVGATAANPLPAMSTVSCNDGAVESVTP